MGKHTDQGPTALVPARRTSAVVTRDAAMWKPEHAVTVRQAHSQLSAIVVSGASKLKVVEHCGMALAALAGVLAIVLPPPVNTAMTVLAGVTMQLRTMARIKQKTLSDAAEVIAGFALIYHLIASKRHLCEYLQHHCMPLLDGMVAITERLQKWVEFADKHLGAWGVFRLASTSLEEKLNIIRTDIKELRDSVHFTATLAMCELMMTMAASSCPGAESGGTSGPQTPSQSVLHPQPRGSERAPSWTIEEVDDDWSPDPLKPSVPPRSFTEQEHRAPSSSSSSLVGTCIDLHVPNVGSRRYLVESIRTVPEGCFHRVRLINPEPAAFYNTMWIDLHNHQFQWQPCQAVQSHFMPQADIRTDPVGISDGKVHEAHGSFGNLGSTWDSRRTLSSFSSTGSEELPTLSPRTPGPLSKWKG